MDVHVGDGRSVEADVVGQGAGAVAETLAREVYDLSAVTAARFSLKVDGVVLRPDAAVEGGNIVELVEITDYTWPDAAPTEASPVDEYPATGTVDDVIAWVGADVERAQSALDAEDEREHPRTTLIEHLEALL